MSKYLFISEKPSVAQEFAKALKFNGKKQDGYMESENIIITWCVGHLISMSYPEAYDSNLKKWSLATVPFLPKEFKYEVIPNVKKQFQIVAKLLNRKDITRIYVCTDSGREGEYIYRLVEQMAGVSLEKDRRRVWIDSQTEEEILRGIKEAKPISDYDNLSHAAYLRAKEDYLMGINFSRVLSLKYGNKVMNYLKGHQWSAIAVGRVMTCVLGMVVRREREIRQFVKTPFYRIIAGIALSNDNPSFDGEWKAVQSSLFFESPLLYKENGFKKRETAEKLVRYLTEDNLGDEYKKEMLKVQKDLKEVKIENAKNRAESKPLPVKYKERWEGNYPAILEKIEKKKENKYPPLLYNLAELQNDCSRFFKITPDETLAIAQELYEKKLVTYPRTDARVLSSAVAKEIHKNIVGLRKITGLTGFVDEVLNKKSYQTVAKSRYVNDSQITDHYAIIPTGQTGAVSALQGTKIKVYEVIVRRFLAIFFPPAVYQKIAMVIKRKEECFFSNFKVLADSGYLKVMEYSFFRKKEQGKQTVIENKMELEKKKEKGEAEENHDQVLFELVKNLKKGAKLDIKTFSIKEGETSPPKRYHSGSMILAMENAGQLIEDEELRAQIKGSGIGTSATRAEILNKLIKIKYLKLNKKTQTITPELLGELVYDVVAVSMKNMLNPEMTASWEKGLSMVANGEISEKEYMDKLENYVGKMTVNVKMQGDSKELEQAFDRAAYYYKQ